MRFAATDPVATEYNSLKAATVTLWRTGNVAKALTVPLAVGGTATNLVDYQIFTNNVLWWGSNVTFAAGANSLALTIRPLADSFEEQAESVIFTIKGSAAYQIGVSNTATVFIDDDHTTRYEVVQRKYASIYQPGTIDSPAIFDLLRWGRSSLQASVPFQMWTNAAGGPIRTVYYRGYGDISGENFVFAPFATQARLNATATTGGSAGTGLDGISLRVSALSGLEWAMWFRPKHEFVRLEIIQTNAVEGTTTYAKLRATRLFNGPAVNVFFTVRGNAKNSGQLNPDHQMFSSVEFSMPTNVLVKETNIVALTDAFLEGWETVILTANDPISIQTTYDFHAPYLVFLRDNVTLTTGLPETDTDLDGLPDRWEVANGFDPFLPGEENLDPDKDGLTNAEEAALNLNPNSADSDGDGVGDFIEANRTQATDENYLAVRLYTRDTGKVNNGANCAVCHTTTLRVGDYNHFSPVRGVGIEKTFFFKRGTNYPIYLSDLVRDLPPAGPTTGSPTTTEQYTAGIVPAENEPRAFVVNDPNAKLGTNKLWSNFPADPTVSIGTLVVPKIEVFWTNVTGYAALDANTNAGGGVRMFPDALSPSDNVNRNRVQVRVKVTPPLNGQIVRLKSFDVDDPAPEGDETLVDNNGEAGQDNRGLPKIGALADLTLTLNASGEATTDFFTTWQPGDNFRVAAVLDTPGASAHLDTLQSTNPAGAMHVTADQTFVKGFAGGLSPMLTVWRKLHLEFDSMDAPPASGPEANFVSGNVVSVRQNFPVAGLSRISIRHNRREEGENLYEQGKLIITGFGTYRVRRSLSLSAIGNEFLSQLEIDGTPGAVPFGTTAQIYDDDDVYLSNHPIYPSLVTQQSPSLQGLHHISQFLDTNRTRFAETYITLVSANAMGWNTQTIIPFLRHAEAGLVNGPFDSGNQQLKGTDRSEFWSLSLMFGYQAARAEDGEPNEEAPLAGVTRKSLGGILHSFCVVYTEAIRERIFSRVAPQLFTLPNDAKSLNAQYLEDLYVVMAHEIGHAPGGQSGQADHAEDLVMKAGSDGVSRASFSGKTIRRFRNTTQWTR